jgi:ATP-dependent Clp endopeptidase proteolytic subunit ClpP
MPYPNEHACRLKDPEQYDRIRRVNCDRKHDGKCIDVLYGVKDNKSEEQAYRYDKEVWTEESARNHCEDNDGTFEPAGDEEEDRLQFPANGQKRPWYAVETTEEDAEISIFDEIGGWFGITVDEFKKDFDTVKNKKKIKLLLNSPGGQVTDGMAVYNLLSSIRSKLSVEVLGVAASIASIIALAGKELIMGEGSYLMIHDPWSWAIGDSAEMRRIAEVLDKMSGQLANIYTRNSTLMKEEIVELMAKETWFTAEEAVEAGFADGVVEYGDIAALSFDISKFHYNNVPEKVEQLVARKIQSKQPISVENSGENKETGGKTMPENKETDDKARIAALEKEISDFKAEIAELKAKVETEKEKTTLILSEKQDLAKELADLKMLNAQTEKNQVIEKALSEGKITPKNRARWEEQYDRDPEGTKKLLEEQEPVVDFSTRGTGAGGDEASLNAEEQEMAEKAGLSKEDIKKYGPKAGEEK